MKPMRVIQSVACFALVLALAACGFQLQGRQVLPPVLEQVRLEVADRQSEFTRALRETLAASGATLVEAPAAGAEVRILQER
jgi:outer membrane lipopolysaccharide assembly protein LptE/RlpB